MNSFKNVEPEHYLKDCIYDKGRHEDELGHVRAWIRIKPEYQYSHEPYRIRDFDAMIKAVRMHPLWKIEEWKRDNLISRHAYDECVKDNN